MKDSYRNINSHQSFEVYTTREKENSRMRPKLLFLAYFFPPTMEVASVRAWNIAKCLTRLGWEVTVITPDPSIFKRTEKPGETKVSLSQEGIRRILTDHKLRFLMGGWVNGWDRGLGRIAAGISRRIARYVDLDNAIGWITAAERAGMNLNSRGVDVILATGPPFASFKLAKRLSNRLGRPYVLDYRDPWTGNPHVARQTQPAKIQEEKNLLEKCAAVTIVSRSLGIALDSRFGIGSKLHVITNGYDPEEMASVERLDFGHFAIVYSGVFYPPKRIISPVMAVLRELEKTISNRFGEWYFHYFGRHEDHVREEALRFGVMEKVVIHGLVPRAKALSAAQGAGVNVVITSVAEEGSLEDKGIVTAKVFEALGLQRPTLVIAPLASDAEAIANKTGLARSFTGRDTEGMAEFISDLISGRSPKPRNLDSYSWNNISKDLDSVLRGVLNARTFISYQPL